MMISFLILLISLSFIFPQSSYAWMESCMEPSGNTVTITTCEQLQDIPSDSTDSYVLANDIDCSSIANFTPINYFAGTINGNGHTISNLTINQDIDSPIGFIQTAAGGTSISNLSFKNVDITNTNSQSAVGCVIGYSRAPMNNWTCGRLTLDNVHCSGDINGVSTVGGLVGYLEYFEITNSSFDGDVVGIGSTIDGFVAGSVGGLIGNAGCSQDHICYISQSSSSGSVNGGSSSNSSNGGLMGNSWFVNVDNSYSESSISGMDRTGGLVGNAFYDNINQSYATGSVSSNGNNVGGLVGFLESSNVVKSYSTGSVSSSGNWVGGLVGYMYDSHIEDSYSTSNISSTYDQEDGYLGGLVGYDEIYEEISCASIIRSYSSGTLTTGPIIFIGGLVGGVKGDPITDSFTTSQDASGNYLALTGFNIDNSSTITNSYSVTEETPVTSFTDRTSPVFTNWDFSTVWLGTSGLPSFSDIVIPSSDSNAVSIYTNSPGAPDCQNLRLRAPDLFQINTTKNTAKLFFTPIDTNQFYIAFSTKPNAEENGELVTLSKEGVQSHTIYFLKPNTTYYIKVRGQNGCMPGKWSDILTFKTNKSIFYKYLSKFLTK